MNSARSETTPWNSLGKTRPLKFPYCISKTNIAIDQIETQFATKEHKRITLDMPCSNFSHQRNVTDNNSRYNLYWEVLPPWQDSEHSNYIQGTAIASLLPNYLKQRTSYYDEHLILKVKHKVKFPNSNSWQLFTTSILH